MKLSVTRTELIVIIIAVLFIGYIIFKEIYKLSWKNKLEKDLKNIDNRVTSGRATSHELLELKARKKAIIQQYLKAV